MNDGLFEQLDFEPNALYEKIIAGLMEKQFCQVPDFLSPGETGALREALLGKYEADQFKKAAIGNRFNEQVQREVRGDFIFWIEREAASPAERVFLDRVDQLSGYLNRTCFLGIARSEFHYALYPPGSYYQRHLDVFQNDDRRKLSLVCYLNAPDWGPEDGGTLVLYPTREQGGGEVVIAPTPGRLVIFESQALEHEVKPASRPRLSLTGWLKTH